MKKLVLENLTLSFVFVFIVSSILTSFVFDPIAEKIKDFLKAKPKLLLNVTEINRLPTGGRLENFKLLFGTQNGQATLVAAQTGDEKLNKLYGVVATPSDLIPCEGCTEYSFSLKNIGGASAKNISLDFLSITELQLIELEKDPKISNVNCGGILNNKGCRLEISPLNVGETVLFTGISSGPGIRKVDCGIDGDNKRCSINFRHYYAQKIIPGLVFEMNGKKIFFPPINNTENFIQYHYVPTNSTWAQDEIKE